MTEYAADATNVDNLVFTQRDETTWTELNDASKWQNRHGELLNRTLNSFRAFDGFNLVVESTVPLPQDATTEDLLMCPSCVYAFDQETISGFDPATFLSAVDEHVISPMQETEQLLASRPYITRLYTTMSAGEMTLDPSFDFNSSLGNVDNQHVAERTIYCSPQYMRNEAPWKTVLPSGQEVHGQGNSWPLSNASNMPASLEVRQEHNAGGGETITDNSQTIAAAIAEHNETISFDSSPGEDGGNGEDGEDGDNGGASAGSDSDSEGGCQVGGVSAPVGGGLFAVLLIGLGVWRRRWS